VDDGKSTLIGRLLVDSRSVLQDQLAGVQRGGAPDLALLTDGLAAEREQGITIDVAYRYFATARASSSSATRRATSSTHATWSPPPRAPTPPWCWWTPPSSTGVGPRHLLPQTRRHACWPRCCACPRWCSPSTSSTRCPTRHRLRAHPRRAAGLRAGRGPGRARHRAVSALQGWNVVEPRADWCGYRGPSLLALLEDLPVASAPVGEPFALPVQWVEKPTSQAETAHGRRVFWGRVAAGTVAPGQAVTVLPGGQGATVVQVLDHVRQSGTGRAGASVGLVLDRELDISRGDWLLAPGAHQPTREIEATVAWLDDTPLTTGRVLGAARPPLGQGPRHEHRAPAGREHPGRGRRQRAAAQRHRPRHAGAAGALAVRPYAQSRALGALVLVDTAHRTAAAVLVR
jgi:sulfate adenylyltransferase subunit 1